MTVCKTIEELNTVAENKVIGAENAVMQNSEIRFNGTGNILVLEEGVKLCNSKLNFSGSNSIIYLSSNSHNYVLNITIYNNCTFFSGENNYINGTLNAVVSEQTNVFMGNKNLFSFGIWLRTADPHIVYSTKTKKRINPSKSIYIGDHVWIGQGVFVLKGSQIASGSIIGAGAVCPGKIIPSNESWAGNPVKKIAGDIFWDQSCVHAYTDRETAEHEKFKTDEFIYSFSNNEHIPFDEIDKNLSELKNPDEKLKYLTDIRNNKNKNRFALDGGEKSREKRGLFHR